jgi:uncharacterized protein YjlB
MIPSGTSSPATVENLVRLFGTTCDLIMARLRVDASVLQEPEVLVHRLGDDGTYPNNDRLPTLLYRGALALNERPGAATMESLVRSHGWSGTWRNGIYGFHHYHSTAHEVLGMARGSADVQLGGPDGPRMEVTTGDVLILPAGVAHKNHGSSPSFLVVGAYPDGQDWDLLTGDPEERPQADRAIAAVPEPEEDPIYGPDGPLITHWKSDGASP